MLKEPGSSVRAVLYGSVAEPRLAGHFAVDDPIARQLQLIVKMAQAPNRAGTTLRMTKVAGPPANLARDRALTAQIAQQDHAKLRSIHGEPRRQALFEHALLGARKCLRFICEEGPPRVGRDRR